MWENVFISRDDDKKETSSVIANNEIQVSLSHFPIKVVISALAAVSCWGSDSLGASMLAQWAVPVMYIARTVEPMLVRMLRACQGSMDPLGNTMLVPVTLRPP